MYNTRGLTVCFILMLLFDYSIVNSDGKQQSVDDPNCPRKPKLARNRKCFKKCRTDSDCRGPNKRCQCDDVCGRSCVKPTAECPRLEVPANGHLMVRSHIYGTTVKISCLVGYRLIGPSIRRCRQTGVWTGKDSSCALVDCGLPTPFYNGYFDGQQTTYGSQIRFRCVVKTTFEGQSELAECQANGNWSFPTPKCWRKCQTPRIQNGSISFEHRNECWVEHRTKRTFICDKGFAPNRCNATMCKNGTWMPPPECVPSSCHEKPPRVRDGLVRFHAMNHGDRAKYMCNTGFQLAGQPEMFCEYGKWTGTTPVCVAVYCDHPGTIDHGQVMLLGVIGRWEYASHFRKVGHNEVIEYLCENDYKRIGPAGATCIDGAWSPLQKPKCQPGKHPNMLYVFRGKRSIAAAVIHLHELKDIHTIKETQTKTRR